MDTSAITMLIVAIATIWGGLGLAIINLVKHPEPADVTDGIDEYDSTAD